MEEMQITFKTRKLKRIFDSDKEILRTYGEVRGKGLKHRMSVLRAAACLAEVPVGKPDRRHALSLNRKGQFAVDISENYRLIFEPDNNPLPLQKDGGLDLKRITGIKILEVEDYHDD